MDRVLKSRIVFMMFLLFGVPLFSFSAFASHPLYQSFSSPENGFLFNSASGLVSVSDTTIYKTGYYSVNGSAWQSFNLSGTAYNGDVNWLSGSSSYTLPSFGSGEHYVIVYTCTYISSNNSWDCHENKWQLIVVNNSVSSGPSCSDGVMNGNETGIDCGGSCPACPEGGTVYYVSTSGNDGNDGLSQLTPWRTLAYAESHAINPGDVIALKRGDTFTIALANNGRLIITQTGAVGSPIVWDGGLWGTGAKATIKGSGFYDGIPLIDIPNSQYLTIQNIIFQGDNHDGSAIIVGGYWSSAQERAQNDITIQDCEFYNIGSSAGDSVYAILVTPYDYNYENITIQRNYINGVGQAGIGLYSGRTDLGAKPSGMKNIYVGHNEIYDYSRNPTGEALLINNRVTNATFEYNICEYGPNDNAGFGFGIGSNEPTSGYYPTEIIIRYNSFKTKNQAAILIQSGGVFDITMYYNKFYRENHDNSYSNGVIGTMEDVRSFAGSTFNFYNNIVVANNANSYCLGHVAPTSNIWHIKNNIFLNTKVASSPLVYLYSGQSDHNNNCYYSVGSSSSTNYIYNGGSTYTKSTIANWESTAKSTDPLLTNLAGFDWHLQAGSPAINAGVAIPGLTKDYDGNSIVGLPDIGAFEYGEGTGCTDDCTPSGLKQCSGTNAFQTCGDYNSDGCTEWSTPATSCPSEQTCSGAGVCSGTPPTGTTYYVSNSGLDTNTGTDSTHPWKTTSKINGRTFQPGDAILFERGGVWREMLSVPSSGTSTNYITFGAYGSGANPRILGSEKSTGWTLYSGNVWVSDSTFSDPYQAGMVGSEIFFEKADGSASWGVHKTGIASLTAEYNWYYSSGKIYIYSPTDPDTRYVSVEMPQRSFIFDLNYKNYINIDSIDMLYCAYAAVQFDAADGGWTAQTGLIIQNLEIGYVSTKDSEAGYGTQAAYSNMVVRNCKVHDCGRRALSFHVYGGGFTVDNVLIEGNRFYNGLHTTGPDLQPYSTSSFNNWTIRNNIFDDSQSDRNYAPNFILMQNAGGARVYFDKFYIYNNIFITHNLFGILMEGTGGKTYIYNNVFYGPGLKDQPALEIQVMNGMQSYAEVKNNIFYSDGSRELEISNGQLASNVNLSNNIFYQATSNMGTGANAITSNPLFVSVANKNFHLQSSSPAINAGIDVSSVRTTDRDGNSIIGLPDIGVFEYS